MQVTHTHHDIQDIRHQVEQAKLRLTTDVKVEKTWKVLLLNLVFFFYSYEIKLKMNVVL